MAQSLNLYNGHKSNNGTNKTFILYTIIVKR